MSYFQLFSHIRGFKILNGGTPSQAESLLTYVAQHVDGVTSTNYQQAMMEVLRKVEAIWSKGNTPAQTPIPS